MPKTKRLSDLDQRLLRYGDLKPFLLNLNSALAMIERRLAALEASRDSVKSAESTDSGDAAVAPTEGL